MPIVKTFPKIAFELKFHRRKVVLNINFHSIWLELVAMTMIDDFCGMKSNLCNEVVEFQTQLSMADKRRNGLSSFSKSGDERS